jgi:hypothetical protein
MRAPEKGCPPMSSALDALRAAAVACGATVVDSPLGFVIVSLRSVGDPGELIPVAESAKIAATSLRVVRDAIRSGALAAVGRQRDRAVRRRDLDAWVESRAAAPSKVSDDLAARVEKRLARKAREAA